jgi:hypothetical protein
MDIIYQRRLYRSDGIFSVASSLSNPQLFVVLEHAYLQKDGSYAPILQPGVYNCVRGMHHLHSLALPFETFEIIGVIDKQDKKHAGVLFHWGNWNEDSEGCSLLGEQFAVGQDPHHGMAKHEMIINSHNTFDKFMTMQKGLDHFKLTVTESTNSLAV